MGELTSGKIVAKTLMSSDFGVVWCSQSIMRDALPIIDMKFIMAYWLMLVASGSKA